MKIGILTIHDSPSYGGSLQCFALWKYITEMGYDCEVIDLHRPYAHKDYIPSKTYKRCRKENTSLGMKYKRLINSFITIGSSHPEPDERGGTILCGLLLLP